MCEWALNENGNEGWISIGRTGGRNTSALSLAVGLSLDGICPTYVQGMGMDFAGGSIMIKPTPSRMPSRTLERARLYGHPSGLSGCFGHTSRADAKARLPRIRFSRRVLAREGRREGHVDMGGVMVRYTDYLRF